MNLKSLAIHNYKESKKEILLLFVAGLVSFALGFMALFAKTQFVKGPQIPLLQEELKEFARKSRTITSLQLSPSLEFIDPQNVLPKYQSYPFHELLKVHRAADQCIIDGPSPKQRDLRKAWQFQTLICKNSEIPESIMNSPPFFSPDGKSYAYLTFKHLEKNANPAVLRSWLQTHLAYFHLLELKELFNEHKLNTHSFPLSQLIQLTWEELFQIAQGDPVIVAQELVLLTFNDGLAHYQVVAKKVWDEYWENSLFHPLELRFVKDRSQCTIVSSNVCWEFDYNQSLLTKWNPVTIFIFSLIGITIVLFLKLAHILVRRKREKEKLIFSLEMLTHELRTPLANLTMQAETLRNQYDQLPPDVQMTSIRMLDQLARVLRITEASRNYLSKDFSLEFISPKMTFIESIDEYVKSCVEPYLDQIELNIVHSPNSNGFVLDPYWTMICINNLIQNAINHGQSPIRVRVELTLTYLDFSVEDGGTKTFDPFQKSPSSKGMGLGLKLVDQILPGLDGQMFISFNPTCFKIKFHLSNDPKNTVKGRPHEPAFNC